MSVENIVHRFFKSSFLCEKAMLHGRDLIRYDTLRDRSLAELFTRLAFFTALLSHALSLLENLISPRIGFPAPCFHRLSVVFVPR